MTLPAVLAFVVGRFSLFISQIRRRSCWWEQSGVQELVCEG